jgi:alkylhydroperoxidase family enzyme
MSRTGGVQDHEAGPGTRLIFWLVKRFLGRVPVSSRIWARDPKLLKLAFRMNVHMARGGTLPAKLKELAQLKVAAMVGCPF